MSTPERDTRYAEQANTLYDDLKAMIGEHIWASLSDDDNGQRAATIEQDTRTYLARRLYDILQDETQGGAKIAPESPANPNACCICGALNGVEQTILLDAQDRRRVVPCCECCYIMGRIFDLEGIQITGPFRPIARRASSPQSFIALEQSHVKG